MDFIEDQDEKWNLFFDGSKCNHHERLGKLLLSLKNIVIPMAYMLRFYCTNNKVEYKALILGLK